MNLSFEERSVWVQLIGMTLVLGGYFVVAGRMLADGVRSLIPFVPVFIVAVVLLVVVLVVGHAVSAIVSRDEERDERDRLIGWRAESNASWIVGVGVILAIGALLFSIDPVWIAHGLLLSMFLSELVKYALQLLYYRRGL